MPDVRSSAKARSLLAAMLRTSLRLALILGLAVGANLALAWLTAWVEQQHAGDARLMVSALLLGALLLYAMLLAVPFVPGIEIGLALLLMQGAAIAPFVYLATVLGLLLAFCVGQFISARSLARAFADLGMRRVAGSILDLAPLSPPARVARLEARLPRQLARPLVRWRYPMVAVLLNLPGNGAMGGGGGLMLLAGISRLFELRWMAPTVLLAVAPVPALVWLGWFSSS